MELSKFLSFCGMIFGFVAVIFLSKVLFASAGEILQATYHYSPMGWPSTNIISNTASQKADTLASVILIFLALVLQCCTLFVKNDVFFPGSMKNALVIGIILVFVVAGTVYQTSIGIKRSFETDIKKLAAKNYVKSAVEKQSVPLYSDVEAIAEQYFNFKREPEEEKLDFLKRFSEYLEYDLPKNADLSKFR